MRKICPITIFNYKDHRAFLTDWYKHCKKNRRGFSFRTFSKEAGFSSPNFLKRVMEGSRNLSLESIPKCAQGLNLNKQETEFFKNLVLYTQATTHADKNFYYQQILKSRKISELKPIEKEQYDYYSTWYHPVIRELITSKNFDGTPEWLSKKISPAITTDQASHSLELLQKLGFIEKQKMGWMQTQPLVTTGAEALSLSMMNYHQNVLTLVKEQLPKIKADNRDISALTLGVAKGRIPELKKKIGEFRQEILKLVAEDTEPENVVLLSIQLLPVSQNNDRA